MEIRATSKRDVIELCGEPFSHSMRGLTVEHNGSPIAIAGILHTTPRQCFANITDEIKKSPKTIVKLVNKVRTMIGLYESDVYAIADENEPTADGLLAHMGFEYMATTSQGRLYRWHKQSLMS